MMAATETVSIKGGEVTTPTVSGAVAEVAPLADELLTRFLLGHEWHPVFITCVIP